ncbi:striated muscle preferentially expressed protein kinase-like isoform X3 [Nelusetta ayraudi]|uniref:striated muscle preferentially expressed protein kinase-like isoform X3 n=1 Tax=Nelusetta ayraudi TaxID=303726 RepID=UPI003F71CD2E
MKKIWSKKRFQRTGHSTRTFGRFTHVFRSCRKQSYDSETTEDETTEPQMETKEGAGRHQDKAGRRAPPGEGGGLTDYNPDVADRRATLPGAYDPVVERELRALGSRPPGLHPDSSGQASPNKSSTTVLDATKPTQQPQSSKPQQATRAGPKISDKVRAFEERRASLDQPMGVDGKKEVGGDGAAQRKRGAFKQRASSLEDKSSYSQKVQSYQSKFAEELQRIKRLVGRPSMKKAFSTEQLPQTGHDGPGPAGKLEPIPPQVVRKLEARERAWAEVSEEGPGPGDGGTRQPEAERKQLVGSTRGGGGGEGSVTTETAPAHQLPRQQPPPPPPSSSTNTTTSLSRNGTQSSRPAASALPRPSVGNPGPLAARAPSPHGKRASETGSQGPPKPPRLTATSPVPSVSPLTKRRRAGEARSPPALKVNIPTILVEDEPMEVDGELDGEEDGGAEVRGHRSRPGSPVEGGSLYDNDEVTAGPRTKKPLEDTAVSPPPADEEAMEVQRLDKVVDEHGGEQAADGRVEVKALRVTRGVSDVAVRAGGSALLECYITGPPDVDVDWLSNGKLIQPALLNCKMHFDGRRCRLLLNSVHEDDSGTYTCKLSTAKEELTSSANLRVTPSIEPLFTRKLDILEVIEGRTARFDCKVSGSPPPRVTWMHFETKVEEGENVHLLQESGRHSLVIARVGADTEGFYTAVAQNAHGRAECTAELYMQEARAAISSHMSKLEKMPSIPEEPEVLESEVERRTMPDFVKPLADVEVIEGRESVLRCRVAGLPYPTISWYHNGKRIESSEERKMTQHRDVHSLVIRSTCHAHGGVYKAVIANKVGKAACYAHLYVTDIVPDPPDGPPVIEAITGKTISLSWKRPKKLDPSFDSSSLLYVVQQQPLGSIQWSVVASNLRESSYTVTSLSKGVRYAFRVLASTGKTLSKPSLSTDLVQLLDRGPYLRKAPVIVDKPDVVYVVENQPASVTITLNHVHAAVAWKRRGVTMAHKPGVYEMSMPDDDQHMLRLQRVRCADVGQLVVTASNQFGSDLCMLQLAMAVPPKFETIMEDVDVQVGETCRLAVVVEGKPDPDILWYKDDVQLSESSRYTFVFDDPEYSLVILNACPDHSGVYTCTAKNLAGANSCKAELTVHTEPKEVVEPLEDQGSILRKMRRLTDYYDTHKEIGRGAFSYVKRVTEKNGKSDFAAKFVSARGRRKAAALREMELLSELEHERILYFHDAFEKKNVLVLITELCHEELLERMARKTTVKELEIRTSVQQLLEGLRYLHHNNIAHLDIKPENILMAGPASDQIRICDFGNAAKLDSLEEHYCKYGTPEYVAPEIINQTPVSTATDIWPVGVIAYLCLTGVSPFAGENDRATALNIRNYNVAFEESMFSGLCKEAKGFVIKLLVVDRLRPSAIECLRHPWFKSSTNKSINTAMLKQVLFRRRWQRSLISYKSKMVMRSIPELLNESSPHVSIAVARHLKEGSPLPSSSSSDSDADVDELPFVPMPLSMVFSGSRVSLNEIPGEYEGAEPEVRKAANEKEEEEGSLTKGKAENAKRAPLKKGSSVESGECETQSRRATMRRGSSADSALLLHIDPEGGNAEGDETPEVGGKQLKKAVSMELPQRGTSPARLSQEEYALKLELMRQRLLRGGAADRKMSGLRGPLFETLGVGEGHREGEEEGEGESRRTSSLDRNLRRSRTAQSGGLARAASTESPGDERPLAKVFRKSASFTQGDSEPLPLHRRFGAPLEIPTAATSTATTASGGSTEAQKLREATSMSALAESVSASPTRKSAFVLPASGGREWDGKVGADEHDWSEKSSEVGESEAKSPSVVAPIIVIEEDDDEPERSATPEKVRPPAALPNGTKSAGKPASPASPEHAAVFSRVATPRVPVLRTDIKDIDSEEVFQARFKKRESSLTRGLRKLTRNRSEERSPTPARKAGGGEEEVYRPGARDAPLEMVSRGLQEKSKSVQDLREDKDSGLGLIGRFSMRAKRATSVDKKGEKQQEKPQEVAAPAAGKRVSWAVGRSKSLDASEPDESSVAAMRRRFENKVAGISARIRTQSEERRDKDKDKNKDKDKEGAQKKAGDSPVLAVRQRLENTVAGISSKIRSQSEERRGGGEGGGDEGRRTPLLGRHRHTQSEGRGLKGMGIPENQLAKQTGGGPSPSASSSKESVGSASSVHSESERRSRWDRWGLSRTRKDKASSQPELPAPGRRQEEQLGEGAKEEATPPPAGSQQFVRAASDFAPVFHIKLRDVVLLEGESVTLSCLPAGSPPPRITWKKDRKPLEVDDRMSLVAHPDGRQLLRISRSSRRDDGVYECVAANAIATITTSCTLTIACVPKRPGTPEVAQVYNNTALVLWKPADTRPPCSYTLERKTEGESNWQMTATGVVDCYYNVTELPAEGAVRFRVACVNRAGQGPYSGCSPAVSLHVAAGGAAIPDLTVVKTLGAPPQPARNQTQTQNQSAPSSPPQTSTPPTTSPPSPPAAPLTNEPLPKTTSSSSSSASQPSAPTIKAPPPFVLPKTQSPVNVVSPMTQAPPPLVSPPATPTKPAAAAAAAVAVATVTSAPVPVSFTPQVLQASSLSPFADGAATPTRGTPSGRATPSTALRLGIPQKPYTFLDEKARGRFAVVRECRENATGRVYMAKIVPYGPESKQDALREYEVLKSLHSDRVMALHEAYVTPRYLVLVAEYCSGKELLYSLIDRFRYSEDDVVGYLVQILQGVEYLHSRRVLHLDLKPDNIMVTHLNAVKIVDFGSAQSFNPLSLRRQDLAAGSLEYTAPEMVKGEVVGPPADIWTVGVVTHIMLSGRLPFEGKDPQQLESKILIAKFDPTKLYPNVSQSASAFLKKMLSSFPWARPTTRDCFTQAWLQDSYLMKLRRQTLTFTSGRLKEFLVEQQCRRTEGAIKHKVLLRAYQGSAQSTSAPASAPHVSPGPR